MMHNLSIGSYKIIAFSLKSKAKKCKKKKIEQKFVKNNIFSNGEKTQKC